MIGQIVLAVFAGGLIAQETDWIGSGNRAWDKGSPEEAAVDYARALDLRTRAGAPAKELLRLSITLATAHLEAGEYREAEEVLQDAQKSAWELGDSVARAELLNAWSALHMKLGQLSAAEAELQEARRMAVKLAKPGDVLPTVLHNLAAVEMRTGRCAEALSHERDALQIFGKTLDPDHPTMIRGWASLASLQYVMGHAREARSSMERALASAERAYGPTHPMLADLLESEAIILDKLKLKKEAKVMRKRARKIRGGPAPARQDLTLSVLEPMTPDVHLRSK